MILLTNDDGIQAPGLHALYDAMKETDEVVVVAPESEMSAVGHAITLSDPLRVTEVERNGGLFGYALNGTPADCVKLAVRSLLKKFPDMVISGINRGANTGTNIIYSGTVSAATEGTILGVPSIAVSRDNFVGPNFSVAASFTRKLARHVREKGLPPGTLLNVNVPNLPREEIEGVDIVPQGKSRVVESFDKRMDPRHHTYYWQAGEMVIIEEDRGKDCWAIRHKRISVTPIHFDLTDYQSLEVIRDWKIAL